MRWRLPNAGYREYGMVIECMKREPIDKCSMQVACVRPLVL